MSKVTAKEVIDYFSNNSIIPKQPCGAAIAVVNEMIKNNITYIEYRNGKYVFQNKISICANGITFSIHIHKIPHDKFVEFMDMLPEKYQNPVNCKTHNFPECHMEKAVKAGKINSYNCIGGGLYLPCEMETVPYIVQAFRLAKCKSQW